MTIDILAADSFFAERTTARLTRDMLTDLAAGLTGAVRITGFLSPQLCAAYECLLEPRHLAQYDRERYLIPAGRLGPVINEFNMDGQLTADYWFHAENALAYWNSLPLGDLRELCIEQLSIAWKRPVQPARVGGRRLFWGMVREVNEGTLVHWDEVVREFPGNLFSSKPVVQLAFNLFLSMPATGGATCVWRRRWQPADERHRVGFGYGPGLGLDQFQQVEILPATGDAVLFDPRNYHMVHPSDGGRRLAVAFFVGLTASGDLIVWS